MKIDKWCTGFGSGLAVGAGLLVLGFVFWYGPTCNPDFPCALVRDQAKGSAFVWIWQDTAAQWVAAAASALTTAFTFLTVLLVKGTLSATQNGAIHQNPPRIDIHQICMPVIPDVELSGSCYAINRGPFRARVRPPPNQVKPVIRSRIKVLLTDKPLPQLHPVDQDDGNQASEMAWSKDWLPAGEATKWSFASKLKLTQEDIARIRDENDLMQLYVVGLMRYGDDLDSGDHWGNHRTLFCRQYCPNRDRFLPLDDVDYEYQS